MTFQNGWSKSTCWLCTLNVGLATRLARQLSKAKCLEFQSTAFQIHTTPSNSRQPTFLISIRESCRLMAKAKGNIIVLTESRINHFSMTVHLIPLWSTIQLDSRFHSKYHRSKEKCMFFQHLTSSKLLRWQVDLRLLSSWLELSQSDSARDLHSNCFWSMRCTDHSRKRQMKKTRVWKK